MRPRTRLTKVAQRVIEWLETTELPIVTPYELFRGLFRIYRNGKKLYLRTKNPTIGDLERIQSALTGAGVLARDRDYGRSAYRVLLNADRAADEICCIVDRFCFISHLSAMVRYGLTDRRPVALHLTVPSEQLSRQLKREAMVADFGENALNTQTLKPTVPLRGVNHPKTVRRRRIQITRTSRLAESIHVRGTFARISTIGQTFVDMLKTPEKCGGMGHILDVWRENAEIYAEEIIDTIERTEQPVVKVRAGYILEEIVGLKDPRIGKWINYAQRGSSRVLDPSHPFAPQCSEKWMLSLNASPGSENG